jgi:hypothetical protein
LEALALTAQHGFPALYCRSRLMEPGTPAAFIFDTFREDLVEKLSSMPLWQRVLLVFIWPPAVILLSLCLTCANGVFVARRYRRSIAAQFMDQIRLAFAHGMPPNFYYSYELHEPHNAARVHQYVHRAYLKRSGKLYKHLYLSCPERGRRAQILNDKMAFDQFCRQRNLPTARLFAVVEDGAFAWTDPNHSILPPLNLFVKPRKANGGRGAQRWTYENGRYVPSEGPSLDASQLCDHLAELSRRDACLIHECLVNHRELQDLTAGALSTLRMYTFSTETGEVEHLFTMLRMSRDPRRVVDNVCRGGLAAQVDAATGLLGKATDLGMLARTGWVEHHPSTGGPILGRRIPYWREALDLAISAHLQLEAPFFVGWDIAITERGPVIVEGNKAPDLEIEQRLCGPWGNQRFGELLVRHIKRGMGDAGVSKPMSLANVPRPPLGAGTPILPTTR